MILTEKQITGFRKTVYGYYRTDGRNLPWRNTGNPYHILVSEMMLQQTQVQRVIEKYTQFITAFPDIGSLDRAPLAEILKVWQGLGYNRRALFLKKIARKVLSDFHGTIPSSPELLETLPGIGKTTACEICTFAFEQPTVFIETNIRSVFIHFFFPSHKTVKDHAIIPLVEQTLDTSDPRMWYYALMDYGVMIKKRHGNPNIKSAHYSKQSPFKNSDRELRGSILRLVTEKPGISKQILLVELTKDRTRILKILADLEKEEFITDKNECLTIRESGS